MGVGFRGSILAGLLSLILAGVESYPAQAQPEPPILESAGSALRNCDGFGGASRSGDGIVRPPRSVDSLGRMEPSWNHSIEYCNRALANIDENFPQYWLRRTSLLQSRAIYQLMVGNHAAALADLDTADASAHVDDEEYQRTLAVNSKLIRAMILVEIGQRNAGEAMAVEATTLRPYNRAVMLAALMILSPNAPRDRSDAVLSAFARLDPRAPMLRPGVERVSPPDLRRFFMLMLDGESPERRGRGWEASRSIASGGCRREESAGIVSGHTVRLCLFSLSDTPAMMEERALLRLAQIAVEQDMPRFLIESRTDISHWAISPYSRVNDQSGYEIRTSVTLLSSEEVCPRCLSAAEVVSDLQARYPPRS